LAFILILSDQRSDQRYENNQSEESILLKSTNIILASSVEGFTSPNPPIDRGSNPIRKLFSSPNGDGSSGGNDGGNNGGDDFSGIPEYPRVETVEQTEERITLIQQQIRELEEIDSESETESETKSETKSEKKERQLKESIVEEKKLNDDRRKRGLSPVTLIIKDGHRWETPNTQIRDKFYHFPKVFGSKTPPLLTEETLKKLADPKQVSHKDRLTVLRSDTFLPEKYVRDAGADLREACIDPDTIVKPGTFGKNMESRGVGKSTDGYILYNKNKNLAMFFNSKGLKTVISPSEKQIIDIKKNNNML
jgi:hypothetical protein